MTKNGEIVESLTEKEASENPSLAISEIYDNRIEQVDYYMNIFEEISKYPFWKVDEVLRDGEFLIYFLNNGTTRIKIRYVKAKEMIPHVIYLLHQSISSYIKKRRVIKTRTKLDFLAKRSTLVIEIKPNQQK